MRPSEVRAIRAQLGHSQSAFAALVGVHRVTVAKWEAGMQPVGALAARLLRLLVAPPPAPRAARRRRDKRRPR
jgi:DNA-binding transcriptional regulator YiaG